MNETPAPRLKLDLTQTVLVDKQAPASSQVPDYDPLTARYLDTAKPVLFPVAIAPTAPKGAQEVKASVVYFYCSTREAWCRRGTADVLIPRHRPLTAGPAGPASLAAWPRPGRGRRSWRSAGVFRFRKRALGVAERARAPARPARGRARPARTTSS